MASRPGHTRAGYPPVALAVTDAGPVGLANRQQAVADLSADCWGGSWWTVTRHDNDDGLREYDDAVPIVATTLEFLAEHGPLGPIWWRYGRPPAGGEGRAASSHRSAAVPIPQFHSGASQPVCAGQEGLPSPPRRAVTAVPGSGLGAAVTGPQGSCRAPARTTGGWYLGAVPAWFAGPRNSWAGIGWDPAGWPCVVWLSVLVAAIRLRPGCAVWATVSGGDAVLASPRTRALPYPVQQRRLAAHSCIASISSKSPVPSSSSSPSSPVRRGSCAGTRAPPCR
ncbi:hypothetical protein GCM10010430_79570 [Kitasatospora cystarginea]|uniref:Uncharacterized protein n=1 Tax=Kitasatospora cystarginea TaxID=58350 RepID=A0ABN3F1L2_9ACTN